ncbi:hypothetical protein [Rhodococcus sp. NPDC058521]|uniref:hypothetical protein n=1 Tax=Rhodococcus sp. NPDC058521 TaxID=3346536 RepID=UPI0036582023
MIRFGGGVRAAALCVSVAALAACGGVDGAPAAQPDKPLSPAQSLHVEVEDALRAADPCGLLDEASLPGAVLQYGSAVQASVCSALIRGDDNELTSVDVSLLPSMLSDSAKTNRTEVGGVTVFRGTGPDLGRGTCERVFALNLGGLDALQYATVRTGANAGQDSCPLADDVVAAAIERMRPGLPLRVDASPWAVDLVGANACDVLTAIPEGVRVVDPKQPPTPFDCTFHPDGVETRGNEVSVTLSVKASGGPDQNAENGPKQVGDRCRWEARTGEEIDVTRPGAEVDEYARTLGRARGVVTVHGPDCDSVRKVADTARLVFG